jgi:hypothetical protein
MRGRRRVDEVAILAHIFFFLLVFGQGNVGQGKGKAKAKGGISTFTHRMSSEDISLITMAHDLHAYRILFHGHEGEEGL